MYYKRLNVISPYTYAKRILSNLQYKFGFNEQTAILYVAETRNRTIRTTVNQHLKNI